MSAKLANGLAESARKAGVATSHTRVGSMMSMFFTDRPIKSYDDVKTSDAKRYARYFHAMLRRGVYFAPSQFEAAFVSAAHTGADVRRTIAMSEEAMGDAG
jgi:glutamate-1-semialdehyde 2,1-aminomutase